MAKQLPWWREPTRAQWTTFMAAWVGWVLDAFDFVIFPLCAPLIAAEFGVPPIAVMGSITLTLVVRLLGGVVAGWMADKWGRKLPLMLSLMWFAVFDALIYFAPSFAVVLVLRTLFGFGMGAEWTAGTAMAMEAWPARTRKIASGLLQAGYPIGYFIAAAVTSIVVPTLGWRAMFLIAAVPAVLVLPIRFLVPDEKPPVRVGNSVAAAKPSFRDLLAPDVRNMLVLGTVIMTLGFAVYYGMTANYQGLMTGELGLQPVAAFHHHMVFNVGMLVGVILAGWVANRYGVIVALVAPALLMVPCVPLFVGGVDGFLMVGAFLGGCLGAGYSGVTPVLTTSLFPEHVRGRAIGFVYHAGALFAAFIPTLIPFVAGRTGTSIGTTMGITIAIALVVMSVSILLVRKRLTIREAALAAEPSALAGPPSAAESVAASSATSANPDVPAALLGRDSRPVLGADAR